MWMRTHKRTTSIFLFSCPGLCACTPLTRQPKVGPGLSRKKKIRKLFHLWIHAYAYNLDGIIKDSFLSIQIVDPKDWRSVRYALDDSSTHNNTKNYKNLYVDESTRKRKAPDNFPNIFLFSLSLAGD